MDIKEHKIIPKFQPNTNPEIMSPMIRNVFTWNNPSLSLRLVRNPSLRKIPDKRE
jgi:hypothetical protein